MSSPSTLLFVVVCTFLLAGLIKGVTGMGLPTVAMGLLAGVMPPASAAALLLVPSLVTNVWQALSGPATVRLAARLWPMLVAVAASTLACAAWLVQGNSTAAGVGLGIALVLYAGVALRAPAVVVPARLESWLSPLVGLVTGAITGATGVFVLPAVPWLQSLQLQRDELVQALGMSFTVSSVALGAALLLHGSLHVEQAGLSVLSVAPALLGTWGGQWLRMRLDPQRFRRYFLVFLLLLGAEMLSRPLRR